MNKENIRRLMKALENFVKETNQLIEKLKEIL